MIILLLIICILCVIAGIILYLQTDEYDYIFLKPILVFGGSIMTLILIGMLVYNVDHIIELKVIDQKIAMFQEENDKIENDIDVLVKQYMLHEKETLNDFKSESSITLVNLYPDLKSNELVQQQLQIYLENNNKIKELKENKITYTTSKWWVYFGKIGESDER